MLSKVKHIFVTHKHIDHLLGMIWMIRLICQNMAAGKYEGEAYIYGHEEVIEMLETICKMLLQSKQTKFIHDRLLRRNSFPVAWPTCLSFGA